MEEHFLDNVIDREFRNSLCGECGSTVDSYHITRVEKYVSSFREEFYHVELRCGHDFYGFARKV